MNFDDGSGLPYFEGTPYPFGNRPDDSPAVFVGDVLLWELRKNVSKYERGNFEVTCNLPIGADVNIYTWCGMGSMMHLPWAAVCVHRDGRTTEYKGGQGSYKGVLLPFIDTDTFTGSIYQPNGSFRVVSPEDQEKGGANSANEEAQGMNATDAYDEDYIRGNEKLLIEPNAYPNTANPIDKW